MIEYPFQISPAELKQRLDRGEPLLLLDVRDPFEFQLANIGGTLLPLGELGARFEELDRSKDLIVLCHHGVRSSHAVSFLRQQGFDRVSNLSGGIDRWSCEIDPKIPRY